MEKNFFKAEISVCVEAVQDAIYEIIGTNSIELVGQAIERDIKNKFESTERDKERARKEQQVRKANEDIEQKGSKGPKKEYTPINSYKPSGNLIYDDELLNKIGDKFT